MIVSCGKSPPCSSLSPPSPIVANMSEEEVEVGSVVRRLSSEVVEEMAALAVVEKARMTAPAPPALQFPGRFAYSQRRPRKLHRPINPAPPETFRVAAMTASWDDDERERFLLKAAEEAARRPRTPTPPRRPDDHFDLARWSVRRWK